MPDYTIDLTSILRTNVPYVGTWTIWLEDMGRSAQRGGRTTIPMCRSCNSSMRSNTLKGWLRTLRDSDHWKWYEIVEYQK